MACQSRSIDNYDLYADAVTVPNGGGAHNNMQAFLYVNYIIKI